MQARRFSIFLSACFAASGTAVIFLCTVESAFVTRRGAALLAAAAVLLFLAYRLAQRWLETAARAVSRVPRWYVWGFSLLLSIPFAMAWPGSLSYLQVRRLEIRAVPGVQEQAPMGKVVLIGLNTGDVTVSQATIRAEGGWAHQDNRFISAGDQPGSLWWTGRTSSHPCLLFLSGPGMGSVSIAWDGQAQVLDLDAGEEKEITFSPELKASPIAQALYSLACVVFLTLLFSLAGLYALALQGERNERLAAKPAFWLRFCIPVAVLPLFFSLAFSPGLMSGDSLVQWTQVQTLQLNDHHPVFDTLFLWLCSRLWNSPAAVAVAQILALALVVGWGLGLLVRRGLPLHAAWLVALLVGLSPVNWLYLNTIWKDIPYSISVLWMTILAFEMAISRGEWLASKLNWLALVLCALLVSLFRHNGAAVSLLFLAVLVLAYRARWRWTGTALVAVLLLRALITGPVYQALNVKPAEPALQYGTLLYHLGAHIRAGTPRTDAESQALAALLPIEQWDYTPCTAEPIISLQELRMDAFSQHPAVYWQMALDFFLRRPWVDLRVALDSGELVYRLVPDCRLYITPLFYKPDQRLGASWIDYASAGVVEKPLLPAAWVRTIAKYYDKTFTFDSLAALYVLFWCPAAALYLLTASIIGAAWLSKSWQLLLVGVPAWIQSAVMMLAILAEQTRYQYSVYLAALYALAFLLYALSARKG
jgi:hypothetical protein